MKNCDLLAATNVYNCCKKIEIKKYAVFHKELGKYCLSLKNVERILGENAEDNYWKAFLAPLKRYRFEVSAAPLFLNKPSQQTLSSIKFVKNNMSKCESLFPQFVDPAYDIFEQLSSLLELNESPLLDFLSVHFTATSGFETAILLKESYLITLAEEILKHHQTLNKITLLMPAQLKRDKCYKNLIIVGPARWFPDYIFNAPRACEINLIRYSWIREDWQPEPVFINSKDKKDAKQERKIRDRGTPYALEEEYLSYEDLIPRIDWGGISRRITDRISKETIQEEVKARIFLLEDEKAVFLDTEDSSSFLIIDLDEEDQYRVKRIPVNDITPNMFVLLRTGGGGDYIIHIADRIMGKEAEGARMIQQLWKTRLMEAVRSTSLLEISLKLIDLGSTKANEINVRNWMSYRNIRTSDYHDFAAIMQLVGLGDRAKECWEVMGMIDTAHRKAGHHIRKLLLKKVIETDLDELQKIGKMDFELPEGGSLTAFRVNDISSEITTVAVSLIAHPFDIRDRLWQG